MDLPSTKPYFLRAIHEWCTDNGLTPHMAVVVDGRVRVPREFVRDGQIVLNVSYDATGNLQIANDAVSFQARFGGVARDIAFPVDNVVAIYARENGVGMHFEIDSPGAAPSAPEETPSESPEPPELPTPPAPGGRPKLQRVK